MQKLFELLASNYDGGVLHEICNGFPKTRSAALLLIGINTNAFIQYIVCPKCHAVFDYEFGFTKEGSNELPKQCPHVEMPNHPHALQRKLCSAYLMKTFSKSMSKVRPFKLYAYQSLKDAMTNLVNRNHFLKLCDHWRNRCANLPEGYLGDIYDGNMWKQFQVVDGINFLGSSYNFCFTLNVDWFQPYTHTREFPKVVRRCELIFCVFLYT